MASATEDGDGVSGSPPESSASMFERLSAEHPVPKRRLFSLLARVRAVVAWRGGLESRRAAVRGRIMALTAMVYCHPSQGELRARWGIGGGAGLGGARHLYYSVLSEYCWSWRRVQVGCKRITSVEDVRLSDLCASREVYVRPRGVWSLFALF